MELTATTAFGLEAVAKREIEALGLEITESADGRISFSAGVRDIARANLWLRTADRVYIKLADFEAKTFAQLIEGSESIPFEEWLPEDARVIVGGSSVKSALHSVPSCQATIKKAVVNRLMKAYRTAEIPETGSEYSVRFMLHKDRCLIMLDTSGAALHKRGYRVRDVEAPIKETLASALVQLSFYKNGRLLADPMCGSGTIPIEAAMLARNQAPGLMRSFTAETWGRIPSSVWKEERERARDLLDAGADIRIFASDIDSRAVTAARANAKAAGLEGLIDFSVSPVSELRSMGERGIIVTNPPYGERIGDIKAINGIYAGLSEFLKENPDWSLFIISADRLLEKKMARSADRRRKLYNGRIETCYYQFHGRK